MSFQPKVFWMSRDAACLTDGEMGYDNSSRIEQKRGQWLMDPSGPQLFGSKKQAMESVNGKPVSGVSHVNVSPWDNTSGFQSVPGQFTDRLFGSEPVRTVNLVDRNIHSIGNGNMNMGRKDFETQFGINPSVGLSMSHSIEDPSSCLSFGGIRKVKVNQVRECENIMSASMGNCYSRVGNSKISMGNSYNKSDDNSISLGPTYSNGQDNTISMAPNFSKAEESFLSAGHTFNKGDGDFILMGHSVGQRYDKEDGNFISIGQSYEKGDGNVMSLGTSYNKGHENFTSIEATFGKASDSFIQIAPSYIKGNDNMIPMGPSYTKADSGVLQMGTNFDGGESSNLSVGQNYNKGESTTISFGGYHDEPETNQHGGIINSYDVLMNNQNSTPTVDVSAQKNLVVSSAEPTVNSTPKADSRTDTAPKNKEPKIAKKPASNNFPSNVKSLLSTGMFDGVPVKYVSWSREKNLRGVIKGTGYLCSCDGCNGSKALNAYEFERHAGCKTKHPNNHIYFENGKTIYAVVQELKTTPQQQLFDAIQNVTGSPINLKNFRVWKASYQAATRELQRIYGKDEVTLPS
ncbi:hypothetical protein UlMin_025710 [Ulmus minor]